MRSSLIFLGSGMLLSACASGGSSGSAAPAPDRVVVVDGANIVKQSVNDDSRATFAAPADRVWPAIIAAYAALGISPTVSDRASGDYGNRSFVFPSRLKDRPQSDYWHCGSGGNGIAASSGRLVASVETIMTTGPANETVIVTRASGRLRSNEGTSTNALDCASRGAVEDFIKVEVGRQLAMSH